MFGGPTQPAPVSDTVPTLFFPSFNEIVRVTRRLPKPVHDSGRDNLQYEFLLVVEVPETSENPTL